MDKFNEFAKVILGSVITAVSGFLGGMDGIMYALLVFVTADYVTGVAAGFKRHELSSEIGFWGIVKKVCIITLVGVGNFIDIYVMRSGDVFRTAIALYYIGNEGISLLENFSRLGVVYPKKIKKFLRQLRDENDDKGGGKGLKIIENFLTPNRFSRPQIPLERVTKIAVHYVGNPGTSAVANRSHDHRFKRWFENSPKRALIQAHLKGEYRKPNTGNL